MRYNQQEPLLVQYAFDALQLASFMLYAHLTLACEELYFEVYTGLDKLEKQLRLAIDFVTSVT